MTAIFGGVEFRIVDLTVIREGVNTFVEYFYPWRVVLLLEGYFTLCTKRVYIKSREEILFKSLLEFG